MDTACLYLPLVVFLDISFCYVDITLAILINLTLLVYRSAHRRANEELSVAASLHALRLWLGADSVSYQNRVWCLHLES